MYLVSGTAWYTVHMENKIHAPVEQMYTPNKVAILMGLAPATIRTWVKEGKLKAAKLGTYKNAPVRIPESEVRRMLAVKKGEIIRDSIFD